MFVGRGFSHDMNAAESVRLYRLRKKAKSRHSEAFFAEESLILLSLESRGIPRSAQNDDKKEFFRSVFSR
jgi:tRNA(Leu) C34 or U34 (ribose-2'-O)-methylase TrmL